MTDETAKEVIKELAVAIERVGFWIATAIFFGCYLGGCMGGAMSH